MSTSTLEFTEFVESLFDEIACESQHAQGETADLIHVFMTPCCGDIINKFICRPHFEKWMARKNITGWCSKCGRITEDYTAADFLIRVEPIR